MQDGVKRLLAQADGSSNRENATGEPVDVLTILRWSFDNLPTDNHR